MNYNITTKHISLTDEVRRYLEKKLDPLDTFLRSAGNPRIDVDMQYKESEEKTYYVELMLHAPGTMEPLSAKATEATLHDAIDKAATELFREVNKTKKKRVHVLRRTGARVKDFLRGWRNRP